MEGIKVIRVKAWNWFEKHWGVPYPILSPKIFSVINREARDADIIHVHDINYIISLVVSIYSKKYKKRLILTQHIADVKRGIIVNLIQQIAHWLYGGYII